MKFSCVIFICSLVIATSAVTMIELTHRTFIACDPDQWIMTNINVEWKNRMKIISCNITYKEPNNNTIYRIDIMMDCEDMNFNCTNEPNVQIGNIDCNSQNLSPSIMDVCKIGNELAKWQKQKEFFEYKYGFFRDMFPKMMFCISFVNTDGTESDYL